MLTSNQRDDLENVFRAIEHLQTLSNKLAWNLRRAMDQLESRTDAQRVHLSDAEVSKLLRLNRRLATIEAFSRAFCSPIQCDLESQIADPDNPLQDFEIDVELQHMLSASDRDYAEGASDNVLTVQDYRAWNSDLHTLDWREVCRHEELNSEPHCYLFHDLYDHGGHGLYPATPPKECLRIGTLFLNVQVTYQFEMNLETGRWEKRSTSPSVATTAESSNEAGA